MKLNFKNINLKEDSKCLKRLKEAEEKAIKNNNSNGAKGLNEFIIKKEKNIEGVPHLKVLQLMNNGLHTFGMPLDMVAYSFPKEQFQWDGVTYSQFDINKECLTVELIDTIQKLNQ